MRARFSNNGLVKPYVLFGLALGSIGMFLGMVAFAVPPGALPVRATQNQVVLIAPTKIAPEVLVDTSQGKSGSVVIFLADQADVTAAYRIKDQDARGWFVYNTLSQHAVQSQAGLRGFLTAHGIAYRSFWAANMITATIDRTIVDSLALRSDVARIDSNRSA